MEEDGINAEIAELDCAHIETEKDNVEIAELDIVSISTELTDANNARYLNP